MFGNFCRIDEFDRHDKVRKHGLAHSNSARPGVVSDGEFARPPESPDYGFHQEKAASVTTRATIVHAFLRHPVLK